MTLAKAARGATSSCQTAHLSVFVYRIADPVDTSIISDGLVSNVHHDDFEEFVGGVLVNPIRVENTETSDGTTNTLFSNTSELTGKFKLVHTVGLGFAVGLTLDDGAFATSTANTHSVNDIPLLGLVSHTTGLVGTRRTRGTVDGVELAKFPASHTQNEAKNVGLFLLVKLLQILVC
eukprot:Lithocolla_globosa_v1_NODE_1561_length_2485_cov_1241.114815.p2 type:complete len:177 gc:universal NODE_1561_length_2485_cov_1241.114815:1200-1730(+)